MTRDPLAAGGPDDDLRHAADRFLGTLLDVPLAARPALLAALAADDPPLYALVASLMLQGEARSAAVANEAPAEPEDRAEDFVGRIFGHWRIVRPIARGATGLVFEAERADGIVRKRATLELVRRTPDDAAIVQRFRCERQRLAALDHPNIARLIDAGASPEGRPFLVTDYVEGVTLDRWCDARGLSMAARVALLGDVCGAVHYAHQRLVVHRDLAPRKLVVTANGVAKVLDLGIAALLEPGPGTIDRSLHPNSDFASPEQLAGGTIATTADVYALGAIASELLTGRTPAALVADLDAIVGKALARDPAHRYESAAALRDDLVRLVANEPVEAVAPSWRYRADKFVQRHRIGASVAIAATLATVSVAAVATREAIVATRAQTSTTIALQAAERRFDESRSLTRTVLFELNGEIDKGPSQAREKLVRTSLRYLDGLSRERLEPDLMRDVAAGYVAISDILRRQPPDNTDEAKFALQKALTLQQKLVDQAPDDVENLRGLQVVETDLGHLLRFTPQTFDAARHFATATRYAERIAARADATPDDAVNLLARRRDEALIQFSPGRPSLHRYDDARSRYAALLADVDAFVAAHPDAVRGVRLQEIVLADLAALERLGGNAEDALAYSIRDLAITEAQLAQAPDDPLQRRDLALATRHVGDSLLELGRNDDGFVMLERSMQIREQLYAADPSSTAAARDLAVGHAILAFAENLARRPREALYRYEQWGRLAEEAVRRDPSDDGHRLDLAQARWSAAEQMFALGETRRALVQASEVVSSLLARGGEAQATDEGREALGRARLVQARALAREGRTAEALSIARRGLASLEENARLVPEDAFASRDLARAQVDTGSIGLLARLDTREACTLIRAGRERLASLAARQRLTAQFTAVIADADAAAARCTR